jgi:hypothetical protein
LYVTHPTNPVAPNQSNATLPVASALRITPARDTRHAPPRGTKAAPFTLQSAHSLRQVPTMSISNPKLQRRLRAARHGSPGGASSLIRVSRGAVPQLPSGAALSSWAVRAAAVLNTVR